MSLVPMTRVPLNIMCSKKWLIPVMPGLSLAEPTRATQPPDTVGESWCS
jgi:hypothetical protein